MGSLSPSSNWWTAPSRTLVATVVSWTMPSPSTGPPASPVRVPTHTLHVMAAARAATRPPSLKVESLATRMSSSSSALMSAINTLPVSVAVQADQSAFQRYSGGIVTSGCGTNLDHGVLAAGYDSSQGYYLVKNSWGASWGDAGYLKISTSGNVCGIHSQPSYPTVSGAVQV